MSEGRSRVQKVECVHDESTIDAVIKESRRGPRVPQRGLANIGRLVGFADDHPLVESSGKTCRARLCSRLKGVLSELHLSRDVLLVWDGQDPIIIDLVEDETSEPPPPNVIETTIDGRRVKIEAQDEIVLQCGEASITLRRNGRVVIRGAYVETRAKGTNRIKGGSVQIN